MSFYAALTQAAANGLGLLLDGYAPQRCLYCDQRSGRAEPLCDVCRGALAVNVDACPGCALPRCAGALCPTCQQRPKPLRIVAPYVYDQTTAYLLRRWKYDGERRLVAAAALLALAPAGAGPERTATPLAAPDREPARPAPERGCLPRTLPDTVRSAGPHALALATPLHWRRHIERGFNQSADLLQAAGWRDPDLDRARRTARDVRLLRRRATARQALAARSDRLRNLTGAFIVEGDVRDRPVVLIDDVCTTGATGAAMASALRDAGAASVTLWCLARTPGR